MTTILKSLLLCSLLLTGCLDAHSAGGDDVEPEPRIEHCTAGLLSGSPCSFDETCRTFSDGLFGQCGEESWSCVDGRVEYVDRTFECPEPELLCQPGVIAEPACGAPVLAHGLLEPLLGAATLAAVEPMAADATRLTFELADGSTETLTVGGTSALEVGARVSLVDTWIGTAVEDATGSLLALVSASRSLGTLPGSIFYADVELGLTPTCGWYEAYGDDCPERAMRAHALVTGDVEVGPGESADVVFAGRTYRLRNHAITDRVSGTCDCADPLFATLAYDLVLVDGGEG